MAKQTIRIYIRMSEDLHEDLLRLKRAKKLDSVSDTAREAIRFWVEEEGDAKGSRKHFNQTMRRQLMSLEQVLYAMFSVLLALIAQIGAMLLKTLDEDENNNWNASTLISDAMKVAVERNAGFRSSVRQIVKLQTQADRQAQQEKPDN